MSGSGNISSMFTGPGSRLAPEISIAWEDVVIELAVVGGGEEGTFLQLYPTPDPALATLSLSGQAGVGRGAGRGRGRIRQRFPHLEPVVAGRGEAAKQIATLFSCYYCKKTFDREVHIVLAVLYYVH